MNPKKFQEEEIQKIILEMWYKVGRNLGDSRLE